MMANITFLSFLLFSMCHSIHVAVNTWLNCSFFTLIAGIDDAADVLTLHYWPTENVKSLIISVTHVHTTVCSNRLS